MSEPNAASAPAPRRGPGCFTTLALMFLVVVIVGGVVAWWRGSWWTLDLA